MVEIDSLRTTAESLLLGDNIDIDFENNKHELNYSISYIKELLNLHEEFIDIYKYELRVRVALHYSPISAINFDKNGTGSRYKLILNYIKANFIKNDENAKKLAESVTTVLNNWDIDRDNKYKLYEKDLLIKQNMKCAHCKVPFTFVKGRYEANSIFKNCNYKVYKQFETTYTTSEVDHIQPISQTGGNTKENLQVLCKLCNRAKSDLISLKTSNELSYAGFDCAELRKVQSTGKNPYNKGVSHLHKLLYFTILRADKKCELCGEEDTELTMRKKIVNGPLIRSNLQVICYRCINKKYPLLIV